ncbi:UDP-phosphate galactose phosphotransferase [Oceanococcus atlanticus]|uniref:UDP-phosphate galactose phosphotransferase n=1 Tax=Oceanococcus atlanticus TaxID=1317117 RepID=A0A1Y1SHI6_9GAMM|nr:UDP-phosphate galactose phosphotransferase [Oceanococcus atlanticus]
MVLVDGVVVWSSGMLTLWVLATFFGRTGVWPPPESWRVLIWTMAFAYPVTMQFLGFYRPVLEPLMWPQIRRRMSAWVISVVLLLVMLFVTKSGAEFSRLWVGSWFVSVGLLLMLEAWVMHRVRHARHQRGQGVRRILLAGSGSLAAHASKALQVNPWAGLRVIGYLCEGDRSSMPEDVPCLGSLDDVESVISTREDIDEVWLALPVTRESQIHNVLRTMREHLVDVRMVPDIFMYDLVNRDVDEVLGLPVIGLTTSPHRGLDLALKRLMDIVGSILALLAFAPIMLVCALAVYLSSPGGMLFRQQRHGLDGKAFSALKFRTMYVGGDDGPKYRQATRDDPRITPVGRVLRRYSLDELPQLFNVLMGDMSLVGPRPHPVNMNITYWDDIDRYALRHRVKPGITGWAQVHGLRGETSDVRMLEKRIEYDLFYIDNWSLTLDIKILFHTAFVIWFQPTAY